MVNRVNGRRSERQLLKSLGRFTNQPDNPVNIDDDISDGDDDALHNNPVQPVGPGSGAIFVGNVSYENQRDNLNGLRDVRVQYGEDDVPNDNLNVLVEVIEATNDSDGEDVGDDISDSATLSDVDKHYLDQGNMEDDPDNHECDTRALSNFKDNESDEGMNEDNTNDEDDVEKTRQLETMKTISSKKKKKKNSRIPTIRTRSSKRQKRNLKAQVLQDKKKMKVTHISSLTPSKRKHSATKSLKKGNNKTINKDSPVTINTGKKVAKSAKMNKGGTVNSSNSNRDRPFGLNIRTSPFTMVEAIQALTDDQKETVTEMGFGSILQMKLTNCPAKLCHYLVQNLDDENLILRIGTQEIVLTPELVHNMLGIPNGVKDIDDLEEVTNKDKIVVAWKNQFASRDISKGDLVEKIKESDDGLMFRLNFITLFVNCICKSTKNGNCLKKIVNKITSKADIANLDWCSYVLNALRNSKENWIPYSKKNYYAGPATLLVIIYLHFIRGPNDDVQRRYPAIANWDYHSAHKREVRELAAGGFGRIDDGDVFFIESVQTTPVHVSQDKLMEEYLIDIKAKISMMVRYKQEIKEKIDFILQNDPESDDQMEIKEEYEKLFSVDLSTENLANNQNNQNHYMSTNETNNASNIATPTGTMEKTSSLQTSDHGGENQNRDQVTPLNLLKDFSNVKHTSGKSPLDSPISPYVLEALDNARVLDSSDGPTHKVNRPKFQLAKDFNNDGPSFDLKLTQGFGSPVQENTGPFVLINGRRQPINLKQPEQQIDYNKNFNEKNEANMEKNKSKETASHVENIQMHDIPLSKQDIINTDEMDDIPLSKRVSKPSQLKRSPYFKREVDLGDLLKPLEIKVSDSLFSHRGDPIFPIFMTDDGCFTTRVVMESFTTETWLALDAIDAWCLVTNFEESLKSPSSLSRIFFNITKVIDEQFGPNGDMRTLYRDFSQGVDFFMSRLPCKAKFQQVDLVFFPIFQHNHYYVIVFDLKRNDVVLLDNRKGCPTDVYGLVPERMIILFSTYLRKVDHPSAQKIAKAKTKFPKLKWQTDLNDIDCGIFALRHMDTFKGGLVSKYDCGLYKESEEQNKQLKKLRKKYATKILLCDLNKNKAAVMQEANGFAKLNPNERKQLLSDAFAGREERMKLI